MRPLAYSRKNLLAKRHLAPDVKLDQKVWDTINTLKINKLRRGCKAGKHKQRKITTCTGQFDHVSNDFAHRGCVSANLVHIPLMPMHNKRAPSVKFAAWNARSVKLKTASICDFIISSKIDILAITESWLTNDHRSDRALADLRNTLPNYDRYHIPREHAVGGGVCIILRKGFSITLNNGPSYRSFEHMDITIKSKSASVRLFILYRPPYSKKNKLTTCMFFADFSSMLEVINNIPGRVMLAGDFNIHVDDCTDRDAITMLNMLCSVGLKQHVDVPTHKNGHTLDLLITRETDDLISDISVHHDLPSDHVATACHLDMSRPEPVRHETRFRKLREIDFSQFRKDISSSSLVSNPASDLGALVEQYDSVLSELLDIHAPTVTRSITLRPHAPWYDEALREQKRAKRRSERKWVSSGLEVYKQLYQEECHKYKEALETAKTDHHRAQIKDCEQGKLFQLVDKLSVAKAAKVLPLHESARNLACEFSTFFNEKITKVKAELDRCSKFEDVVPNIPHVHAVPQLSEFTEVSHEEMQEVITSSKSKSCPLDPIPSWVLKKCLDELLPTICDIVNHSITSGEVPAAFKEARLTPLIKKQSLDPECLKNYRPVSNLSFLSKITERCVAKQLTQHLDSNNLHGDRQSAYRKNHSTETALTRVANDILQAMDAHGEVVLVLLDLTAAFDTIDHSILLQRLTDRYGINGSALQWFQSYLSSRFQAVVIDGVQSEFSPLSDGVPQGSVLGPLCFSMYTAPLEDIIRSFDGIQLMVYADDTQIYMLTKPSERANAISQLEQCICSVKAWMSANRLKLNEGKTEILHIRSKFARSSSPVDSLRIGSERVESVSSARNLGVAFDNNFTMATHVNNICRAAHLALRKIGQIRKYLDSSSTERLVHAFISSRLDCCNGLLFGLPEREINKLQQVQNTAARMVACVKKHQHITPVLEQLHWLPVRKRIVFKILLLTYKSQHGLAPEYISELLTEYKPSRSLRSGAKRLLKPVRTRSSFGDRAFAASAPKLWNQLPETIKCAGSVHSFKSLLKTYLFKL